MKNVMMSARQTAETKIRHSIHSCRTNDQLIAAERMITIYQLSHGKGDAINRLEIEVMAQRLSIKLSHNLYADMWDVKDKVEQKLRFLISIAETDSQFDSVFLDMQLFVQNYGDISDELMQYYLISERNRI